MELFLNAIVSGLLLGGFYAAVALGLAIAFGYLDIVNIAHPAFVIVGSYVTYMLDTELGLDPVLSGITLRAGLLRGRRGRLPRLLRQLRAHRAGIVERPRVLLWPDVHHRGPADHDLRRRLSSGRRPVHRLELAAGADHHAVAHARAVRRGAGDDGLRLPLPLAHLYRPGDSRRLAGSPGAAPDGRRSDQDQAGRLRPRRSPPPRSPARC